MASLIESFLQSLLRAGIVLFLGAFAALLMTGHLHLDLPLPLERDTLEQSQPILCAPSRGARCS